MSQPDQAQLSSKVLSRIKEYKTILAELGYSQSEILNSLAQLFHLHHSKTNSKQLSLPQLAHAIASVIEHNSKM